MDHISRFRGAALRTRSAHASREPHARSPGSSYSALVCIIFGYAVQPTNRVQVAQGRPVIELRPLRHGDVPACVEILRALPQWFGMEQPILDYARDLESLDGAIAVQAERCIGFVGLKRYGAASVEINVMAVHPAHRRSGIGRKLIRYVEDHLVDPRTRLVHMKTLAPSHPDPNYIETRAFWEAMGFIPMDEHLLWGDENPCLVMVKPL